MWPFDPALQKHGATYQPANAAPGQPYWQLVEANGPLEWGGRHAIFVDVLGEARQRLTGVPVRFFWADRSEIKRTEAKTGDPYAVDLPMFAAGNAYGVRIDDGMPSDQLFGMGLLAYQPHVSYRLLFQRTVAGRDEGPLPPPLSERQAAFARVLDALEDLRKLL